MNHTPLRYVGASLRRTGHYVICQTHRGVNGGQRPRVADRRRARRAGPPQDFWGLGTDEDSDEIDADGFCQKLRETPDLAKNGEKRELFVSFRPHIPVQPLSARGPGHSRR